MIARRLLFFLPFVLPAYLIRWRVGMFPTSALEVFLFLTVAVWFWERRLNGVREGWQRMDAWCRPTVAWLFVTLAAVLVAPSWWHALGLWRAYVLEPLVVFLMIADMVREQKDADGLRRNVFLIAIFLAAWAAIQFATGFGIPHPWDVPISLGRRATGPFPYPNALALFIVPVAVYAFASWMQKMRALELIAWTSGLAAILLAKSDGGLVAMMAAMWIAIMLRRRTRLFGTVCVMIALALIWFVPFLHASVLRELSFQGWSGKVRLILWKETWLMLKDHWFFGAGFGAYPSVIAPYHRATFIEIFQYPHNILLNLWSEVGLLGIAAFAWIVATWAHVANRLARSRTFAFLPVFALLVHGLVDVPYFKNDLAVLFWILAALTTFSFDRRADER